jgi:hypothetical protein
MKYEDKLNKLKELREAELYRSVIIPLLQAIGYSNVHENHGVSEKGKDIIFREVSKLKDIYIHAAVVSTKNITGKVGDSQSASRILEQVEMALNEPYQDKYTGKTMHIDRCWVITSGRILNSAIDSISGKLEKYNLNKLLKFIDCERLIELLNEFYPQFWDRSEEKAYYTRIESIEISTNKLDKPFDIETDELSAAGNLKDTVHRLKKSVYSLLLDLQFDITDKLADILKSNHPREVATIWEILEYDAIDRHGCICLGSRSIDKIKKEWEYLTQDLGEYEEKFKIPSDERIGYKKG